MILHSHLRSHYTIIQDPLNKGSGCRPRMLYNTTLPIIHVISGTGPADVNPIKKIMAALLKYKGFMFHRLPNLNQLKIALIQFGIRF